MMDAARAAPTFFIHVLFVVLSCSVVLQCSADIASAKTPMEECRKKWPKPAGPQTSPDLVITWWTDRHQSDRHQSSFSRPPSFFQKEAPDVAQSLLQLHLQNQSELRYLLRSYQENGLMSFLRNIFVVVDWGRDKLVIVRNSHTSHSPLQTGRDIANNTHVRPLTFIDHSVPHDRILYFTRVSEFSHISSSTYGELLRPVRCTGMGGVGVSHYHQFRSLPNVVHHEENTSITKNSSDRILPVLPQMDYEVLENFGAPRDLSYDVELETKTGTKTTPHKLLIVTDDTLNTLKEPEAWRRFNNRLARVHNIPNLSEWFLLSPDDAFLLAPVTTKEIAEALFSPLRIPTMYTFGTVTAGDCLFGWVVGW